MLFNEFIKNRKLSKTNALDLIPVQLADCKVDESGRVILQVLRFRHRFVGKLFNKSEYFSVRLDEMGSKTWLLINGKDNIEHISQQLSTDEKNKDDLMSRVILFITELYRKDLVTFVQA